MNISKEEFYDKVYACWMGKNIGGTLGGPLEGIQELLEVSGYTQEFLEPVENDDLDLQLVNLHALEQYGGKATTTLLSQEWLSHVFFQFDEYGHALSNMRHGIAAPLSGYYNNFFRDCMGSPIRSELWGIVCAGKPDDAAYYAFQDAAVDHAGGEGVYGEIFFAVFEAMAFENQDIPWLIEKSLSYIPTDCCTYQAVRHLMVCYDQQMNWLDTRKSLIDTFDNGNFTYAPLNIAFTLIGLLYGEGFTERLLISTNCGYDTDCTCATIASMMGILYGSSYIDKQWTEPLGEEIRVSRAIIGLPAPKNITELTNRSIEAYHKLLSSDTTIDYDVKKEVHILPQGSHKDFDLKCEIRYERDVPAIAPNQTKQISLSIHNHRSVEIALVISLVCPNGFTASAPQSVKLASLETVTLEFSVTAPADKAFEYRFAFLLKEQLNGLYWCSHKIPFTLLPTRDWQIDGTFHAFPDDEIRFPTGGKRFAKTTLLLPEATEVKLIVAARSGVRLVLDGETVIDCEKPSVLIPAYHRSDPDKCVIRTLKAGAHQLELSLFGTEKEDSACFYTCATDCCYYAKNLETVLTASQLADSVCG